MTHLLSYLTDSRQMRGRQLVKTTILTHAGCVDFSDTLEWSALSWGQNDAHEFLALLVDAIHSDLNRVRVKRAITRTTDENDNRLDANTLAIQSWNEFQRNNDSIITDLFYGQYVSSIHCTVCPKISLKFDPFVYLSLPIPIKHTDIHLTDCLRLYTAPEYLSHPNSWYCPKCKTNREARKQIHFWRLPHIVIIQLKRFCFDVNSCPEKITGFVDFPLYNLDLSPYCLSDPSFSSYDLYAVVNHYGDVNGGHYTAFCRDSN
ncbi:unnamed protein product, partial [Oppiella nova]